MPIFKEIISEQTQILIWKYSEEEKDYEVEQFIGIYNNILWVYLNARELIGIDVETGKLKYRFLGIEKKMLLG